MLCPGHSKEIHVKVFIVFMAACLSVAAVPAAYGTNPLTSTEYDPVFIDEQSEIEIGKNTDRQLRQKYRVSNDANLNQRINAIGQRLAAYSGRRINYTFTVLDDEMVNAFAAPGGFIYITTGLLRRLKSDNETAAVLGHEIGHVVEKHSLKALQRQMLAQFGLQIMGSLLGGDGGLSQGLILKGSEISAGLLLLKNSRVNELQADIEGVRIMRIAGYNPRAMVDLQRMLLALTGSGSTLAILSTHPPSQERIDVIIRAINDPNFRLE
jgi:predicted Zn-dependent protease